MLDRLNRLARLLRPLQGVLLMLTAVTLIAMVLLLLNGDSQGDDRYLIPTLIAFLWFLSSYTLITNFQVLPARPSEQQGLLNRTRRHLLRGWYRLIGLLFILSNLALIGLSWRLLAVWLKDD